MKYLLLLLLLGLVFFMLGVRRGRPGEPEARRERPPAPEKPKAMLRCAECGMHLPADEARPGDVSGAHMVGVPPDDRAHADAAGKRVPAAKTAR